MCAILLVLFEFIFINFIYNLKWQWYHYLCLIVLFVIWFEVIIDGQLVLLDQLGGGYGRSRPLRKVGAFGFWFFIDWTRPESISRRVTSRDKRQCNRWLITRRYHPAPAAQQIQLTDTHCLPHFQLLIFFLP